MYCPECGNKIEDSHNFCGLCGTVLEKTDSELPETGAETRTTWFDVQNNITGENDIIEVEKDTFKTPILLGSGSECDVVLESTGDSVIFEQHALLGHMGHHTYLRTKRDSNGKIPASVNKYGHLVKNEDGDYRLSSNDRSEIGYCFQVGHYTIHMF